MWQSSLNHHLNFWYLGNNPRMPRGHLQYPDSYKYLSVSLPLLFHFFTKPHANNWPRQTFFPRQLSYFYTHSFSFSQFRVSENLSTRTYEPSKGHKGIFGPLESPSLPVTTWLPPSDGMLCGMEDLLPSGRVSWHGEGLLSPILKFLLQSEKCSSYQHVSKQQ